MFIHYYSKNKYYIESVRNYFDDYSNCITKEIDMTISGKYIASYPKFNIDFNNLDKYPNHDMTIKLENEIKRIYPLQNEVIIGAGTNGILHNLVKIFFVNGGNLVTPFYTFNQPEYAVSTMNGITRRVLMNQGHIDFSNLFNSIDNNTKMIYICNPNNPTGIYIKSTELLKHISEIDNSIPIVIDESGIEFTLENSLLEYKLPDNVIVLRTFSKAFGLANLRIGYMCCSTKILEKYKEKITINEVSGISCSIALQMLKNKNYQYNIEKIIVERNKLKKNLEKIGIVTYESKSNILLTSTELNKKFFDELLKNNISTVPIKDEKGNMHIRIAIQDEKINKKFILTISKILKNSNYKVINTKKR